MSFPADAIQCLPCLIPNCHFIVGRGVAYFVLSYGHSVQGIRVPSGLLQP